MTPSAWTKRVAGLAVAAALLAPAREAAAYCQMTTVVPSPTSGSCAPEGTPLAWNRRCIEYALDMRGSADIPMDDVSEIVAGSFATWLAVDCDGERPGFDVEEAAGLADCQAADFNQRGGNVNVVAFVPDIDDGAILALTTVWYSTSSGEIFDADILVNESEGPFGACPSTGCFGANPPHDLRNVLTHEVGHFFGLAHSSALDATMFASSVAGETKKRSLAGDDEAGFCATYGDAALPPECTFLPRGGRDLSCHDGSGGCTVSAANAGPGGSPWPLALLGGLTFVLTWGRRRVVDRRRARGCASDTLRPRE